MASGCFGLFLVGLLWLTTTPFVILSGSELLISLHVATLLAASFGVFVGGRRIWDPSLALRTYDHRSRRIGPNPDDVYYDVLPTGSAVIGRIGGLAILVLPTLALWLTPMLAALGIEGYLPTWVAIVVGLPSITLLMTFPILRVVGPRLVTLLGSGRSGTVSGNRVLVDADRNDWVVDYEAEWKLEKGGVEKLLVVGTQGSSDDPRQLVRRAVRDGLDGYRPEPEKLEKPPFPAGFAAIAANEALRDDPIEVTQVRILTATRS